MVVAVGKEIEAETDFWVPIIVFGSIALYNVVELNYMVLGRFRRRRGLYFWSLLVATWGIALNGIGYLFQHLQLIHEPELYSTLICLGWVAMVTGQSVVLYSRLYLVMPDDRRRRWVLAMIAFDAIAMHIPVIVLVFGSNSSHPEPFIGPYVIYEKVQLTVFFLQEIIISGLYVSETTKMLQVMRDVSGKRGARRVLTHLIFVNLVVIILDISVLGLEFSDYYTLQTGWKPLVYSVKLKMELSILNQLVELTRSSRSQNFSMSSTNPTVTLETFDSSNLRRFRRDIGDDETGYKVQVGVGSEPSTMSDTSGVRRDTEVVVDSEPFSIYNNLGVYERDGSDRKSVTSISELASARLPNHIYT